MNDSSEGKPTSQKPKGQSARAVENLPSETPMNSHSFLYASLLFLDFRQKVEEVANTSKTIHNFTPHGISHFYGVQTSINQIIKYHGKSSATCTLPEAKPFTCFELLLLRFSAWAHDAGMIEAVAEKYAKEHLHRDFKSCSPSQLRAVHDKASASYLTEALKSVYEDLHRNLCEGYRGTKGQLEIPGDYRTRIKQELSHFLVQLGTDYSMQPNCDAGHNFDPPPSNFIAHDSFRASDSYLESLLDIIENPCNKDHLMAGAQNVASTVNLFSRYHRRAEDIRQCPRERSLFNESIRTKFLAAVLRLADALHVDRTRFAKDEFDAKRSQSGFSQAARIHWIKSQVISAVYFDLKDYRLHVQLDLPADHEHEKNPKVRELVRFILTDLDEDVQSVANILLENHFPPIVGVVPDNHYIPGVDYPGEIQSALESLFADSSPNTSQLITSALDRYEYHLGKEPNPSMQVEHYVKLAQGELAAIREQIEKRPCHEGLRKFIGLLEGVCALYADSASPHIQSAKAFIEPRTGGPAILCWTLLKAVAAVFREQRRSVQDGLESPKFSQFIEEYTDIVLYGYSEQVINFLSARYRGYRTVVPTFNVLECRTKTLYSASGQLKYLDAHRYARGIKDKLPAPTVVNIEPDIAVANIIKRSKWNVLVLLGSNAVYEDGTFVHSMGNMTIAATAKSPYWNEALGKAVHVVVLADRLKIGSRPEVYDENQRNPNVWLTHDREILDELHNCGVHLCNGREDRVPLHLIDAVLILDGDALTRDGLPAKLGTNIFDARGEYCTSLEKRLLAATIARMSLDGLKGDIEKFPSEPDSRNWAIAECFLEPESHAVSITDPVRNEIGKLWGENERKSVNTFRKNIEGHKSEVTTQVKTEVSARGYGG